MQHALLGGPESVPSAALYRRLLAAAAAPLDSERVLWNFTAPGATVSDWVESSDGTAREAGMSTGSFKLQVSSSDQTSTE